MNTTSSHNDAALIEAGRDFDAVTAALARLEPIQFAATMARAGAVPGYAEAEDRRSDLTARIVETPAHTIEGLAAKARNAAEYNLLEADWETPRDELDWDKLVLIDVIEAVCAAAGVDRFGRPLSPEASTH